MIHLVLRNENTTDDVMCRILSPRKLVPITCKRQHKKWAVNPISLTYRSSITHSDHSDDVDFLLLKNGEKELIVKKQNVSFCFYVQFFSFIDVDNIYKKLNKILNRHFKFISLFSGKRR